MPLRNPVLQQLRRRRVPAWWQDAKLGIFVHWTPASVPGFAPSTSRSASCSQSGRPRRARPVAVHRVVRELAALPRQPGRRVTTASLRRPSVRGLRSRLGSRSRAVGPRRLGGAVRRHRRALRRAGHQAPRRLLPLADRRSPTRTAPAGTRARRRRRAGRGGPRRGHALRHLLLGRSRLDVRRPPDGLDWPTCSPPIPQRRLPRLRRAQVRELIARYRPSVLWNDIAWPARRQAPLAAVRALLRRRCPTGSSTTAGCRGARSLAARACAPPVRRLIDAGARRAGRTRWRASSRPSRRTSTCARRSTRRSPTSSARRGSACGAWTTASATTRASDRRTSSHRTSCSGRFVDIVAKGGNLLLNVGPRGVDAQIPDEQLARLDWLAEWIGPRPAALHATRPWVTQRYDDCRGRRGALHGARRHRVRLRACRTRVRIVDTARRACDRHDDRGDDRWFGARVERHGHGAQREWSDGCDRSTGGRAVARGRRPLTCSR